MSFRDFCEKAELYTVSVINDRQHQYTGVFNTLYRVLLFILSRLYRNIVQLRLTFYKSAVLRQQTPASITISVGNITTGGTGKTPVVELLAKRLAERGHRVAILSRGYRSKDKRTFWNKLKAKLAGNAAALPPRIVSDGQTVLLNSEEAGDEPFMLASNLLPTERRLGTAVLVDRDRVKSADYAIEHFNSDTLILDDGFQYLRLRPKFNILLVDTTNPFHNHEMLPAGLLREPIKNIRRANYIFLTKSNGSPAYRHLRNFLARHNPTAPIIECNHVPCYLQNVLSRDHIDLSDLKGRPIAAISAIATPKSFLDYLTHLGASIVYSKHFADHHRYKASELQEVFQQAQAAGAKYIVTTEKDAVRLPPLPQDGMPVLFLRVEIKILKGHVEFEKCIASICME